MKNKILSLFITSVLFSCSTYNHQSDQERYIYELKTEPIEVLFTEPQFKKGSHKLKFYIHDLDDSTFQCKNVQIYDSTIAVKLEPVAGDVGKREQLNIKNIRRKNEVHINIDRQCTNKNSQVYLEPIDIVKFQTYTLTQQEIERTKGGRSIGIVFLSAIGIIGLLVIVAIINLF